MSVGVDASGLECLHSVYWASGISKNSSLRPERPVRLTLGKHRTLTATQEGTPVGRCLLTQPDATPNHVDAPDATPNLQEAPGTTPNVQEAL